MDDNEPTKRSGSRDDRRTNGRERARDLDHSGGDDAPAGGEPIAPTDSTSRRGVLLRTGAIAAASVALAGCTGGGTDTSQQQGGSQSTNTATATPTATATETTTEGATSTTSSGGQEGGGEHGSHEEGEGSSHGGENESGHGSHEEGEGSSHGDESGGGHRSHGTNEMPSGPSPRADVTMLSGDGGQHFEPHVVWVEKGGTVTWTLESGTHSTTAYHPQNDKPQRVPDGASAWDSGVLTEQGATFEHTFETKGVYDYFCIPHESMGMIGSVIVGTPDPHDQPALQPPQNDLPGEAPAKIEELNGMVESMLGDTH